MKFAAFALEVDRYNEESARLQQLAKVDPERCLQLEASPAVVQPRPKDNANTPSELFTYGFRYRRFLTVPNNHERDSHWPAVRETHPLVVDALVAFSGLRMRTASPADSDLSITSSHFDTTVARGYPPGFGLRSMIGQLQEAEPGTMPASLVQLATPEKLLAELCGIQLEHKALIEQLATA